MSSLRVSGIAVAALFAGGNAIWALDMPAAGAPVSEVTAFYRDTADRIAVGASLSLLAIAALVWFAAALRDRLAAHDEVLAMTAFGGGILVAATGLGAETINMAAALRAREDELGDALARSLFEVSQILGSTASAVGLGVLALAAATVALRTGDLLPRWIAVALAVVGVVLLSPLSHVAEVAGAALVAITLTVGLRMPALGATE